MRSILLVAVALSVAFHGSEAGASQKGRERRSVEVIVMGTEPAPRGSAVDATAPRAEDNGGNRQVTASNSLPTAFRTHDLSRRWVAFEMANSFAAATAQTDPNDQDPFAHVGVASTAPLQSQDAVSFTSPIAIPGWMREGVVFSSVPTSSAPGCAPSGYRPASFLDSRTEYRRSGYYEMMSSIACEYGIPVGLFDAMIIRESGYKAGIYSPKNAFGLTQLMPGTAADLGVNRYDVEQNLRGGARYLRQQLDRFGQVHLALAAYNAGPSRVRDGMLPRIAETQAYVDNVLLNWRRLAALPPRATVQVMSELAAVRQQHRARRVTVFLY